MRGCRGTLGTPTWWGGALRCDCVGNARADRVVAVGVELVSHPQGSDQQLGRVVELGALI